MRSGEVKRIEKTEEGKEVAEEYEMRWHVNVADVERRFSANVDNIVSRKRWCIKRKYGLSPAAIAGSNTAGGLDVCLMCVLCVVR
jgi:hypothetical protein